MILCIFEGEEREPCLFETLKHLYFPTKEETIICSFKNNIYDLYSSMTQSEFTEDIFPTLQKMLIERGDTTFSDFTRDSFAEVYLFFDYDCHHQNKEKTLKVDDNNKKIKELLNFFDNETENGKLYINYPMVESIRYTKKLPDSNFFTYTVPISECSSFKKTANSFSHYGNLDFIAYNYNTKTKSLKISTCSNHPSAKTPDQHKIQKKNNWEWLKEQNVKKAHYICTDKNDFPITKESILQSIIFQQQELKYVQKKNEVSILNAFPLFLYDYFPVNTKQ